MAPKPPLSALQAKYAALSRDRDPDDPELIAARRDWAFARFEGQISDFVKNFPPMTEAQRQKVAAMLKVGRVDRESA